MKIIVSRNHLLARLRNVGRIIKSGKELMYSSFMFDIDGDVLTVYGCDESGQIKTTVNCTIQDAENVRFLVDSSTLLNSLKELPEQPLTIEVNVETLAVKIYYHNGKFELTGADAKLFPEIKNKGEQTAITLNSALLFKGLRVGKFANIDDTLRPIMTNINFACNSNYLAFAASNGHWLGIYEEDATTDISDFNVNIPARIAKIVSDMLPTDDCPISIVFDERTIQFTIDNYTIAYRLNEGNYPNYRSVIPGKPAMKVVADCSELISAINRVSVFADESSSMIVLYINDTIIDLTSESTDYGRNAKETLILDAVYDKLQIGLKSRLLLDILKTIDTDRCEMHFSGPDRAVVFKPAEGENATYLLMPMLVNQ